LLSGVGPKSELERLGIEVVLDRPGIGKNFHDHNPTRISCLMAPSFSDRLAFQYDENRLNAGKEQWLHYQTGPMTFYQSSLALAFFKMPQIYQSREFELLSAESQAFIQKATVPHGKLALVSYCLDWTRFS
jgi:choline dehydrogenase-like flavoprotein